MTEDTRRALDLIEPMAKELKMNVSADKHYLFVNGQAIGIACNSTYATINEFMIFAVLDWARRHSISVPDRFRNKLKEFWYSDKQVEQFRKAREEQGYE